ncbi:MAG: glycosyltransferase [Candidatus Hydrogenedentes bacterium]|jgi:teichuronic acid biosynthesis glycosyltransferase TuaG|nr:glycosyltransferase [Candidatus Hydrogenedentota bacterium]
MAAYARSNLGHLREAIESVLAQTHREWELIVALDGPVGEEARGLLEDFAAADARIRLLPLRENRGQAFARNRAIEKADGEFIAVLDADDRARPERLERQLAYLDETGADLAGSFYFRIDGAGEIIGKHEVPADSASIQRYSCAFNPVANSTVIARAAVFKENRYYEPYRYGEDYRLWIDLMKAGYELVNQPEFLVEFRVDSEFMSRRRGAKRLYMDLANKLDALPLYPLWQRPFALGVIAGASLIRVLPSPILNAAYGFRARLRFGKRG